MKDFAETAKKVRVAGKVLLVTDIALDVIELCKTIDADLKDSDKKLGRKTASNVAEIGGSWGGSIAGAELGAYAGALTGPFAPIAVPVLSLVFVCWRCTIKIYYRYYVYGGMNMFFKKEPKVTIPKEFELMLVYNGDFKPTEDDSNLLFEFEEWGYDDSDFEDDFREVLAELISDLCKDYHTAIVVESHVLPHQSEDDSVKIGKGADISLLNSYFNNPALYYISTLHVISSQKEIPFKDENINERIKKLLDMPYILRFDFDSMYNESDISVDISVIDKEFIVESVRKLCEKKKIDLDISIHYRKQKCGK